MNVSIHVYIDPYGDIFRIPEEYSHSFTKDGEPDKRRKEYSEVIAWINSVKHSRETQCETVRETSLTFGETFRETFSNQSDGLNCGRSGREQERSRATRH